MKHIWIKMISLLLICCMLPSFCLADSSKIVRITHYQKVNVRSGPSSSYRVLGEVSPDDTFPYLGSKNGWHCIQYTSTKTGYVYGNLSTVETIVNQPQEEVHDEESESVVYISHSRAVNVRRGPGKGYGVMCEVHPGEIYLYLGTASGWHCILLDDGSIGYVANNLTTVIGESYEIVPETGSSGSSSSSSSGSSRSTCTLCKGNRRCKLCAGTGQMYGVISDRFSQCTLCFGSGVCQLCFGRGYR